MQLSYRDDTAISCRYHVGGLTDKKLTSVSLKWDEAAKTDLRFLHYRGELSN
jgi:hypothetical protein